jgi:hypothetical protein
MVFNLGYAKTSDGVCKIENKNKIYFVINTEQSMPHLGLATGDLGLNYTSTSTTLRHKAEEEHMGVR